MNDRNIARAVEALDTLSRDPAARDLARQRRVAELEYQSGLREARAEGLAEGEAKGLAEGEAKGLQEAIRHLCQVFKIELTPEREERLSQSTVQELLELHEAIAGHRVWPERKDFDKT